MEQMESDPMFQKSGTAFFKNGEAICTDLLAGQYIDVGEVQIWNDADNLYVKYIVDVVDWCLTETHVHVATSLEGIPQKNGNPIPGKFDYMGEHDCVYEVIYEIPLDWDCNEEIYIASHAVVKKETDLADFPGLEAALPDQVTMIVTHPGTGFGAPSYFDATISGGTVLDGRYDNYCIDTDHTISPGTSYTANVYSSYGLLPDGLVEYPENLDLVNWIINQGFVGQSAPSPCTGVYTYGDVQRAIWALVEDEQSTSGLGSWSQCRVDAILAAAYANGEGFIPGCGDQVAVILVPVDESQITIAQVTFIQVGVPCLYIEETAWRGCYEFPGKNWALYSTYEINCCKIYLSESFGGTDDGSIIYTVSFQEGKAVLTEEINLVDQAKWDKPHLAVNPVNGYLYLINNGNGTHLGVWDGSTLTDLGSVSGLPNTEDSNPGTVLAAFSETGDLYVANNVTNKLYLLDISGLTPSVAQEWSLPGVDVQGADMAFIGDVLYLWSNADDGLWEITFNGTVATTLLTERDNSNMTGLAYGSCTGYNLIGSSTSENGIYDINTSDGNLSNLRKFYLGGSEYDYIYGDMASGL